MTRQTISNGYPNEDDLQRCFRDKHAGKLGFVGGTGVSLASVDPELLYPYVTIATNEAMFLWSKATYFHTSWQGAGDIFDFIEASCPNTTVITPTVIEKPILTPERRFRFYTRGNAPDGVARSRDELWTMRPDDAYLANGSCAPQLAAHLLYVMGCNPIVLLGCDCCYKSGIYAFYHLPGYWEMLSPVYREAWERQYSKYRGATTNETWRNLSQVRVKNGYETDDWLGTHAGNWNYRKQLAPSAPIVDASDGVLDCFPKASISEILLKYRDSKHKR